MKTSPLLVVPMLGASLVAQTPLPVYSLPERGMLPAFQAGIVFDNDMSLILRKSVGLPAKLDTFAGASASGVPEFTVEAIRAQLEVQAGGAITLQIDAMSTGNDLLPIVSTGSDFRIDVAQAQGWATLYLVRTLYEGPDVGADVVGYYFENPTFPPQLQQGIYQELVRSDYVPALDEGTNIAAIDFAMGLIDSNRGQRDPGIIQTVNRLYFSLTATNVAQQPNLSMAFPNQPLDGATIFVAEYDATGALTRVAVHATRAQLQLEPYPTVDIDALAMFEVRTTVSGSSTGNGLQVGSFCYVISAQDNQLPDELMVVATPAGSVQPLLAPLRTQSGLTLIAPVGGPTVALTGYAKGVCSQDPDFSYGAMSFGVPFRDEVPVTVPRMRLSLTAEDLNPGDHPTDRFLVTGVLSGWISSPGEAQVIVGVQHLGLWSSPQFANRTADQDTYTFQLPLEYAFVEGLPINDYRLMVVTFPLAGPAGPYGSISSVFRRRRYPNQ